MNTSDISQALALYVQRQTGADTVSVTRFSRLSGGAIQSNYALSLECAGGSMPGPLDLVVRSDAPSKVDVSMTREQEFDVLSVAYEAGVTVPRPLWLCADESIIGQAFCIMMRVPGTASGRQLVRGALTEEQSRQLVGQLGRELACLHKVTPPHARLGFLSSPAGAPALARVQEYRQALDQIPEPHPVLEWALNWLEDHAPESRHITLCHGDFRTGHYMVHEGQVSGVLDWEFASFSDPYEDLGWLCARSWRFGVNNKEVGGIGHKQDLFQAYAQASGREIDPGKVLYWEVMAITRWAVIALQQAQRHLSGEQTSLELALTGRLLPEMEFDLLNQIREIEGKA